MSRCPLHKSICHENFPFRWKTDDITYLGIRLPGKLTDLYDKNFLVELRAVQQDLLRWDVPTISWFGHASILKMTVLSRILYKLQMVPIHLPPSFFMTYKRMCRMFLWGSKALQISWAKLVMTGELAWATHLAQVVDWRVHIRCMGWVPLENLITGAELRSVPWFSKKH